MIPREELALMLVRAERAAEVAVPVGQYRDLVIQAARAPTITGAHNLGAMLGRQWPGETVTVEIETFRDLVLQAIAALPPE